MVSYLHHLGQSLLSCHVYRKASNRLMTLFVLIIGLFNSQWVLAADAVTGEVKKQPVNMTAIVMFFLFVILTLGITYWASKQTKTVDDFYTAGGGISGTKNGLAIAGDYMSAAAFLGLTAITYTSGYDGLMFAVCFLVGWPMVLFLIAERLRNLGRYTFADVISYRFAERPSRVFAAVSSLIVVAFYLIVQIVGAGKLIQLLFGLDYIWAVFIVGILMMLYVLFGGMLATTWVQIIKAVLLLSGGTFMMVMVLYYNDFSLEKLITGAMVAHKEGANLMHPGKAGSSPIETFSTALGLMFGIAGLPHILMRFFTVPDAKQARKSVFIASTFIGYFNVLTFIIGLGAMIILNNNPAFFETIVKDGISKTEMIGGTNMAAIHLAEALGGNLFLGFISAVAFATILAVVAGLTLSGASAVSHDLYASVIKKGNTSHQEEIRVSRITVVVLSFLAVGLGLLFEKQNLAFMVSLAFSIAASANFPILLLAMFWKGLTTRGVVWGGFAGLIISVLLIVLGPAVWVDGVVSKQ